MGVSLSNKNLTTAAISQIDAIARSEFDALRIAYLIADEIDLINMRLFETGTETSLRTRVEKKAKDLESIIREGTPKNYKNIVQIVRWKDILDRKYWELYFYFNKLFYDNGKFRNTIMSIARLYSGRRKSKLSDSEEIYLCQYLLSELPTLLCGIHVNRRHYGAMIYPSYKRESLAPIITDIVRGCYNSNLPECIFAKIHQFEIDTGTFSDQLPQPS